MSIFSKLFVNFAAEFLTAYVIISVYWSSPIFIQQCMCSDLQSY